MQIERIRRSLVKTFSWRIMATITTMIIVYVITGHADWALMAGGADLVAKLILYYFHERAWNKIQWGKFKHKPFVLWFTGLSGAGKSTLADAVAKELKYYQIENCERLDGDVIREIFPQTGFSKEDRDRHIKRVGHLAAMLEKYGAIIVASFISPYKEPRDFVRDKTENFIEIFVDTPLEECEKRDPKGLYKKARAGYIKQFTGIDDPYEKPENPEIVINTANKPLGECVDQVSKYLKDKKYIL